jgi:hypothetical protein
MLLLWLALGLDFALSFLLPQATILWKRTSLFFIGIALMLVGMAFRFYAMSVLGRFFTYDVAIHAGQTVIEVGPYRYIRHPSYTGALMNQSTPVSPTQKLIMRSPAPKTGFEEISGDVRERDFWTGITMVSPSSTRNYGRASIQLPWHRQSTSEAR